MSQENNNTKEPESVLYLTCYTTVQRQTAVTAYFPSKQLLPFAFAFSYTLSKKVSGSKETQVSKYNLSHNKGSSRVIQENVIDLSK